MDTYDLIKKEILEINQELLDIIETTHEFPNIAGDSFDIWKGTCDTIEQQVKDDIMRVAVVGAIKSGKSTFVNSLFKGDYLKRGAGVVTSIVTRIRQGQHLKATLYFKTWDEINAEIDRAMVLFPSSADIDQSFKVDIKDDGKRQKLAFALSDLQTEQLISQDTRSASSVLLSCYLKGYERVKSIISETATVLNFESEDFESHREFVGDDSLSVFLNDVQLKIVSDEFGQNLEIADCQGSDSPNPLHLAMIQNYLVLANLIIYVVSSRTGIRQADIRFLSMIKKMGLIDNTFFVINCDLNEHDSIEDLDRLRQKIGEDLSLIASSPEVYSFSSLYYLFKSLGNKLQAKDKARVNYWEDLPELISLHQKEIDKFKLALHKKITDERAVLLAQNHLTRLSLIASGVIQWTGFNKKMLVSDADSIKEVALQIDRHKARIEKVKKLIKNTLNGAVVQIKKDLRREIDGFFDTRSGTVLGGAIDFVRSYPTGNIDFAKKMVSKSFANALFMVYQDFKQSVDLFMAESVNPEIVQLVHKLERQMVKSLESVSQPFEAMVTDALKEYSETMAKVGIEFFQTGLPSAGDVDLDAVKRSMELKLPPVQAAMHYSARIKTEAVARLGYYTVVRLVKKMVRKKVAHKRTSELKALKVGIRRMKREMEKSMDATFKDFRENIKFQYFLKLADAIADDLYARLLDQFQTYVTDLSAVKGDFVEKRTDTSEISMWLDRIENLALAIDKKIGRIKQELLMLSG